MQKKLLTFFTYEKVNKTVLLAVAIVLVKIIKVLVVMVVVVMDENA